MAKPNDLWVAYSRILLVEAAYWAVSISMVFVNEFVLSSRVLTDDLTIFITIFQIFFSLSILITLNYITKNYIIPSCNDQSDSISVSSNGNLLADDSCEDNESDEEEVLSINMTKSNRKDSSALSSQDSLLQLIIVKVPHRLKLETCKQVFPLSILYVGMLLLNNFCLKNVGVAFYFVSRSLTTVFNVIFTHFLIKETVSRGALICCALIIFGFILGIDQESVIGSLSVIGVFFGVASSLFTSLFTIYTKKTLIKVDRSIWTLVLYNNINAVALCTPLVIVHGDIQALISDKVVSPTFWALLSLSGVMAFFISIVTNASIKYTSPLTHNISGTAKACLQTVLAVIYRNEHKSVLWWTSNLTILLASGAYSRIKQLEMEKRSGSDQRSDPSNGLQSTIKFTESNPPASRLLLFNNNTAKKSTNDKHEIKLEANEQNGCSVKIIDKS